jgi:hypothetical protein
MSKNLRKFWSPDSSPKTNMTKLKNTRRLRPHLARLATYTVYPLRLDPRLRKWVGVSRANLSHLYHPSRTSVTTRWLRRASLAHSRPHLLLGRAPNPPSHQFPQCRREHQCRRPPALSRCAIILRLLPWVCLRNAHLQREPPSLRLPERYLFLFRTAPRRRCHGVKLRYRGRPSRHLLVSSHPHLPLIRSRLSPPRPLHLYLISVSLTKVEF